MEKIHKSVPCHVVHTPEQENEKLSWVCVCACSVHRTDAIELLPLKGNTKRDLKRSIRHASGTWYKPEQRANKLFLLCCVTTAVASDNMGPKVGKSTSGSIGMASNNKLFLMWSVPLAKSNERDGPCAQVRQELFERFLLLRRP